MALSIRNIFTKGSNLLQSSLFIIRNKRKEIYDGASKMVGAK
jgi:hypothetical protein